MEQLINMKWHDISFENIKGLERPAKKSVVDCAPIAQLQDRNRQIRGSKDHHKQSKSATRARDVTGEFYREAIQNTPPKNEISRSKQLKKLN